LPSGLTEVYFEFVAQGAVVKVTAIDAGSGIEASIIGPAASPRTALEQAAFRKLQYVLKRGCGET
jgi:hypothetical protein